MAIRVRRVPRYITGLFVILFIGFSPRILQRMVRAPVIKLDEE
jgi:ABC-type Fe3+-siderophore transport system permease subunit